MWKFLFSEGDKNLVRVTTKVELFLLVEGRISKLLASPGLLFVPYPIRENPAVWSQLGPKSKNLILFIVRFFLI